MYMSITFLEEHSSFSMVDSRRAENVSPVDPVFNFSCEMLLLDVRLCML